MARKPVQFQPGLSLPEFLDRYGTETQCREALFTMHWPNGFIGRECDNTTYCVLARGVLQCHHCHHQTSLTAGTIFHATKLPLRTWFLAIYLLTQRNKSVSALQLSRELGVSYNTAWQLKHKILQVMLDRCDGERLSGRIEFNDAYLGGERPGKRAAARPARCRLSRPLKPGTTVARSKPSSVESVALPKRRSRTRHSLRLLRPAISSAMAWGVSESSISRFIRINAISAAAAGPTLKILPSIGSIRCWVTSKMPSLAACTRSAARMCRAISPSSNTVSIDDSIYRP